MREYMCKCGANYGLKLPKFIATQDGIFLYSEDDMHPANIHYWNGSFCGRCANIAIQFLLLKGLPFAGVYFFAFFRGGYIANRQAICRLYREDVGELWKTASVRYEKGVFHVGNREILGVESTHPFCDVVPEDGGKEEVPNIVRNLSVYPYSTVNDTETARDGAAIARAMGLKRAVWMRPFEAYVINTEVNTVRGGSL